MAMSSCRSAHRWTKNEVARKQFTVGAEPVDFEADRQSYAARTIMNQITLKALAVFPEQLEAHYGMIPAKFAAWTPDSWDGIPSERFTPIEQVCHVRDIEIEGYHLRLDRVLHESHPFLVSI